MPGYRDNGNKTGLWLIDGVIGNWQAPVSSAPGGLSANRTARRFKLSRARYRSDRSQHFESAVCRRHIGSSQGGHCCGVPGANGVQHLKSHAAKVRLRSRRMIAFILLPHGMFQFRYTRCDVLLLDRRGGMFQYGVGGANFG